MKTKYKCLKCGSINKPTYHQAPNPGSYLRTKCKCGNKGNSMWKSFENWNKIDGFEIVKPEGLNNEN